jgi:hypothetical protein
MLAAAGELGSGAAIASGFGLGGLGGGLGGFTGSYAVGAVGGCTTLGEAGNEALKGAIFGSAGGGIGKAAELDPGLNKNQILSQVAQNLASLNAAVWSSN